MGYCIEYSEQEGKLSAVVSGKASLDYARRIARDIAEQASSHAAKQLLIDVRRLMDRVGSLGTLMRPVTGVPDCRVAVLDVWQNDPHYVFSEHQAHKRGAALRLFYDPAAALRWLHGDAQA
jgi:hypothetical protein